MKLFVKTILLHLLHVTLKKSESGTRRVIVPDSRFMGFWCNRCNRCNRPLKTER